jgi:hypothetical protein
MPEQPENPERPPYVAYYVPERDKPFWTQIGGMWPHADGEGFTLDLELMPIGTSRIVIRNRPEDRPAENGEAQSG